MKTYLVFPPHWEPTQPYLSCPTLTAFLRAHGQEARQQDANIEYFDYLMSESFLRQARDELLERTRQLEEKDQLTVEEEDLYQVYTYALLPADRLVTDIRRSLYEFRNTEKFFDLDEYYRAIGLQQSALRLASAMYHPSAFSIDGYTSRYRYGSTRETLLAVEDKSENMFTSFFEERVLPNIEEYDPGILGISLISSDQIIPAFTLASLVKERMPHIHIVAGGGFYTRMLLKPERLKPAFKVFDSISVYEGETSLLRLAEELEGEGRLDRVPNLIFIKDEEVQVNKPYHAENVKELPTPTFEGFPLDLYLSNELVLPYLTCRGCYFGECAFCTSFETYQGGYRVASTEQVIRDLRAISRECNSNTFFFTDQALAPTAMKRIAKALLESGDSYNWIAEARFEKIMDRDLLSLIRKSGCRKIYFGLESGHPRVLDFMEKGYDLDITRRILRDCTEVEIGVHAFLIGGFPTETEEEADETVSFVTSVEGLTDSPGFSFAVHPFTLDIDAKVGLYPERYGIDVVPLEEEMNQTLHYPQYRVVSGMQQVRLESKTAEMRQAIHSRLKFGSYPVDGAHNLAYLIHYGWDFPEKSPETATLRDLSFQDFLKLIPVVSSDVSVREFRYFMPESIGLQVSQDGDSVPRRLVSMEGHYFCYIGRTGQMWVISSRGKEILDLIDGNRTIHEICSRFEEKNPSKTSYINASKDLKTFFMRQALEADLSGETEN